MKRVQTVIASFANLAQRGFKLVRRQQLHSTISIPSSATPAGALDLATLSGALDENRIGVIDMNKDTPRRQSCQCAQRAIVSVNLDMPHATTGFLPGAGADHF